MQQKSAELTIVLTQIFRASSKLNFGSCTNYPQFSHMINDMTSHITSHDQSYDLLSYHTITPYLVFFELYPWHLSQHRGCSLDKVDDGSRG